MTTEVCNINASKLFVDDQYQRLPQDRAGLLKTQIANKFDESRLGVLSVSAHGDGRYAIVDGGGRHYAVTVLLNKPNYQFRCEVHRGLTIAQEARLCKDLNRNRKAQKPIDIFKIEVCEGVPVAVEIFEIVRSYGMSFRDIVSPEVFQCLHRRNVLPVTISVIQQAWGQRHVTAVIYAGVGALISRYPEYDRRRLIDVLERTTPADLIASIHSTYGKLHMHFQPIKLAAILTREYNRRRRVGRLDESVIETMLHMGLRQVFSEATL